MDTKTKALNELMAIVRSELRSPDYEVKGDQGENHILFPFHSASVDSVSHSLRWKRNLFHTRQCVCVWSIIKLAGKKRGDMYFRNTCIFILNIVIFNDVCGVLLYGRYCATHFIYIFYLIFLSIL